MNARAVENGLTIALGKATSCAIYSVQYFVVGGVRGEGKADNDS